MEFEAFRLRECISKDKSRIDKFRFDDFVVNLIGENALVIVRYYRYNSIVKDYDISQRQLHEMISADSVFGRQLKDEAFYNRYNLYDQKIDLEYAGDSYSFEIKGVGPQAIQLSRNFTYEDIVNADDSLSLRLNSIIQEKYLGFLKDKRLSNSLYETWQKEELEREKRMKQILEEERIRIIKQQELEEFLNS